MKAEDRMHRFMHTLRESLPEGRVWVFHGPERYIWRKALDYLSGHTGKPLLRLDASETEPREVSLRLSRGLWGDLPLLWVDHVEAWKERSFAEMARVLANPPTRVVFTSTAEKLNLPRDFPGEVVFFPKLSYRSQERWLRAEIRRRGLALSEEAYRFLWAHVRGEPLEKVARMLDVLELYRGTLDLSALMALLPGISTRIYALADALLEGDRATLARVIQEHGEEEGVVSALKHTALKDLLLVSVGKDPRIAWKRKAYDRWQNYFTRKDLVRLWHALTAVQVVARNQGRTSLALRHTLFMALERPWQRTTAK